MFFLLTLSIVSNLFVSVGSFMNERFAYMPSVAFCVLIAWLLSRKLPEFFKENPDAPGILTAGVLVGMAGFFAWRTMTRVPDGARLASARTTLVSLGKDGKLTAIPADLRAKLEVVKG